MSFGPRSSTTLAEVLRVMKTMRRGSFFASDAKPDSSLFFSIFFFRPHGEPAIFLHAPEVDADEKKRHQRKNYDVKHIESKQGVLSNDISTKCDKTNFVSDERHGGNNVGADGHRPESKLVPRQEVTRVTEEESDQEQHDADDPVELIRRLVPTAIENVKHVPEDKQHHKVRADPGEIAQE